MIGALAGDIIGSIYEHRNIKTPNFPLFDERCRFTDDSVLTVSLADSILTQTNYTHKLKEYFFRYSHSKLFIRLLGLINGMKPGKFQMENLKR